MKEAYRVWLRRLESYAENCRAANPVPERNRLSSSQVLQRRIIKGSLRLRLKHLDSMILPAAARKQGRPERCIIFTSNDTCLAAASEIGGPPNLPVISLLPGELRYFLQQYPDSGHRHHVHIWSHFLEELDSQAARFARRYPLDERERYWLHVEGTACGPGLVSGAEHLWSWDGSMPKLLKKNLFHWAA